MIRGRGLVVITFLLYVFTVFLLGFVSELPASTQTFTPERKEQLQVMKKLAPDERIDSRGNC